MTNFEYFNPTHYIFGKNQLEKLPSLLERSQKILLAYGGGSIFNNGIYNQIKEALKGYDIVEFGGIEPNPRYETLQKAIALFKTEKCNFILAVGGGSVIDGVKFMSAATYYEGDPIDILKKRILFTDVSKVVPFGTVLTLPATGSEMNSGAVVTIEATQEKLTLGGKALFPKFSICDPSVVATLPKRQLQNGVVDAFVHVLEQYLTYKHEAYLQDRIAEGILQTLIEIGPKVIENPADYTLASNFMWCATMALNGLIQKGVPTDWATHMIGHELTALYEIDHARTLAIIGPQLYRVVFESKKEKLAQFAERVWKIAPSTTEEMARQAIEKTEAFFNQIGIATQLSGYVTQYDKTAEIIVARFSERGWKTLGEKQQVTLEKVKEIVENCY